MSGQPRTAAELAALLRDGQRVDFLFFWGHRPEPDGRPGKGCLSQWWPAPFVVDGRTYPTAEHYMMWRKAMLFDDPATGARILDAPQPRRAKELGRAVGDFDQQTWERHRYEIVVAANTAKFGQHPELRDFLLGTGRRVLVEASPMDRVWGIGLAADDPRAAHPDRWRGLNLLGFALGAARATLTG